jgi:hypothetical protein
VGPPGFRALCKPYLLLLLLIKKHNPLPPVCVHACLHACMMSKQRELDLTDIGKKLANAQSKEALMNLLPQAASMLEDVEQSPPPSTIFAMKGCSDALVDPTLLGHKDKDVGVLVALCISEIMRIVAPDAPYSDDCLKVVFVFFIVAQVFILVNNKTHTLSLLQFLSHPDTKKVVVVVVVLLCRKFSS